MAQNTGNQTTATTQRFQDKGGFPVADHDYDIVSALANELQGLEKYMQYAHDSTGDNIWQTALQLKRQLAELFTQELAVHAREGHFGAGQHGNS